MTNIFHSVLPWWQVSDPSVLPDYPYRDDGLLLYNAINKYVTSVIEARYGEF